MTSMRAATFPDGSLRRTLRAVVEYDGTDFCGLQFQPHLRSVAGELETALTQILSEPVKIAAAGRTDAGVHATGQVISFSTGRDFPFERLTLALNSSLPSDIAVRDLVIVDDGFSARFSARQRTYRYVILNRRTPSALLGRYSYHVYRPLDLALVERAADALLGEHDFRSFCGVLPESGITVRIMHGIHVTRTDDLVCVEVSADGFLHRMVRIIVGTLVEIATGQRNVQDIRAIISARDRRASGHTAPPQGLCLTGVRYPDFDSYSKTAFII
ncbi:MAG: tRNA pseudouridine(38-40) synthase TruA [Candidatus Eremiobacteraeota bacterium]|nr:tRNA pseudouridine(38-40) synthase TruA [Candidatus Eremiobacteraeota bacterium]